MTTRVASNAFLVVMVIRSDVFGSSVLAEHGHMPIAHADLAVKSLTGVDRLLRRLKIARFLAGAAEKDVRSEAKPTQARTTEDRRVPDRQLLGRLLSDRF